MAAQRSGPLSGVRVIEVAGIGPGPFAGMMLADAGAEVIRVDRPGAPAQDPRTDILARSRRSIVLNLQNPHGVEVLLRLVESADVLFEGFRPGVAERLGFGPAVCLARNPRLVYGRMTGWGQDGPLAPRAGHDINYIALTGALHAIGPADQPPPPPLNVVGDFGGGGMLLAFGIVCALLAARESGEGQVVDAAMVDGVAAQIAMHRGMLAAGRWQDEREANLLDGAAPFYRCYRCADGRYLAVGAIEPKFYAELLDKLGIDEPPSTQHDTSRWPALRRTMAEVIATRTRDEWMAVFEGSDACVAPVLSLGEAPHHPHNRARGAYLELDGVVHPVPAPRFSATPAAPPRPAATPGADTDAILAELGYSPDEVASLRESGAAS